MLVKLEEKEYNIEVDGSFMLKLQEQFNENLIMALYKCMQQRDILTCAKLTYCAIKEELPPFNEWISNFKSPLFILNVMDSIVDFIVKGIEPTIKPDNEGEDGSKKKTIVQ